MGQSPWTESSKSTLRIARLSHAVSHAETRQGDVRRCDMACDLGGRYWDRTSDLFGVNKVRSGPAPAALTYWLVRLLVLVGLAWWAQVNTTRSSPGILPTRWFARAPWCWPSRRAGAPLGRARLPSTTRLALFDARGNRLDQLVRDFNLETVDAAGRVCSCGQSKRLEPSLRLVIGRQPCCGAGKWDVGGREHQSESSHGGRVNPLYGEDEIPEDVQLEVQPAFTDQCVGRVLCLPLGLADGQEGEDRCRARSQEADHLDPEEKPVDPIPADVDCHNEILVDHVKRLALLRAGSEPKLSSSRMRSGSACDMGAWLYILVKALVGVGLVSCTKSPIARSSLSFLPGVLADLARRVSVGRFAHRTTFDRAPIAGRPDSLPSWRFRLGVTTHVTSDRRRGLMISWRWLPVPSRRCRLLNRERASRATPCFSSSPLASL